MVLLLKVEFKRGSTSMSSPTSPSPHASSGEKKWQRFKAALSIGKTSVDRASFYMLRLYRTNLEVRLRCIDQASLQSENQKQIYSTVTEMLKAFNQPRTTSRGLEWDETYKAERLIALLFSGEQLRQEISARLQELAIENLKDAESLRRDYEALLKLPGDKQTSSVDDFILRVFLLRVMEALHWNAKKKYLARPIRKEATKIILLCVIVSFLLVIAPYVILNFWPPEQIGKWWSLFALYTALTSGLLGAFFSRLITVQRHWADMTLDEVFLHRELSYTLLRAGVGMCGALIVYFFLRSGLVSGAVFPDFKSIAIQFVSILGPTAVPMTFVMPSESLALLTFWCFLAGFSEALVPSILANTERQLSQASTMGQKTNV
jgi:hypothetical protein